MIDIHSHVVPLELPFGVTGDDRWPRVDRHGDRGRVEIAGRLFRVIRNVAWDMGARIDETAAAGITVQAIAPMPELFAYWSPVKEAIAYCSAMNEWIAARVREHPHSLTGLGIVPLQDVEQACRLLAEVKAIGLNGVEVGSNIGGTSAGNARFLPFYQEAERQGLCVFVHSFHSPYEDQVPDWSVNGVTFPLEAGFVAEALIANGILDATPAGRIGVSHGGGGASLAISRLQYLWDTDAAMRDHLPTSPQHAMRRLYYDSLVFSQAALDFVLAVVGSEHVCVGTDHPFFALTAGIEPVLGIEVAEDVRESLLSGNARRFLGLDGAP